MKLYLDTSALVKLYVEEEGAPVVRNAVAQAELVATAAIAYVEARAAFVRRRHEGGLSTAEYRRIIRDVDSDWARYLVVEVTDSLIRDAARLAEAHRLRAYDAIHLASAAAVHDRLAEPIMFASWDA
ncbi:MAG: type II toxin-antitoxin system VapC family toxin, partial [candidate division NC10 bacterium]